MRAPVACATTAVLLALTAPARAQTVAAPESDPNVVRIEATAPAPPPRPRVVAVPPALTVPLRVEAAEPLPVVVTQLAFGVALQPIRCTAPCGVRLVPGLYQVTGTQADGRRTGGQVVVAPPGLLVRLRRAGSPAGGITLAVFGGAAFITGIALSFAAIDASLSCSLGGGGSCTTARDLNIASVAVSIAGAGLAAGGIVWAVTSARGGIESQRFLAARRPGVRWALAPTAWSTGAGAAVFVQY